MPLVLHTYPDPILSESCEPVDPASPEVYELAQEMIAVLVPWKAAGLAAPQIGYDWQLFVMKANEQAIVCVNPFIDPKSGKLLNEEKESCLSLPGITVKVVRWSSLELQYFDLQGKKHFLPLTGFAARVAQHEYDHLQGKTLLEHATQRELDRILKRYACQAQPTPRLPATIG